MPIVSAAPPSPDRCPGILRLHDAADGRLARVRLPGGRVDARGLRALAAVARLGNGVVELTSRAGVQLRGLPAGSAEACWELLEQDGLAPSATHERVRNIIAAPLGGRHSRSRGDTDAVVAELDARLCADPALAALSGRFLFAVDDGSGTLGPHRADVVLRAERPGHFTLLPGGTSVPAAAAAEAAVAAAHGDVTERAPATTTETTEVIGCVAQRDGRIAVTGLAPLGRLTGATLDALAELVRTDARISSRRTVTLLDVAPAQAGAVLTRLDALGLITDPAAGWVGLSACAGAGACALARFDVRAAAARRAGERGPGAPLEHWAGCERHCGRPVGAIVVEQPR